MSATSSQKIRPRSFARLGSVPIPPAYQKHQTHLGAALSTIRRTAEAAALRFLPTEQMTTGSGSTGIANKIRLISHLLVPQE
jgi:hypothetical protein